MTQLTLRFELELHPRIEGDNHFYPRWAYPKTIDTERWEEDQESTSRATVDILWVDGAAVEVALYGPTKIIAAVDDSGEWKDSGTSPLDLWLQSSFSEEDPVSTDELKSTLEDLLGELEWRVPEAERLMQEQRREWDY